MNSLLREDDTPELVSALRETFVKFVDGMLKDLSSSDAELYGSAAILKIDSM